MQDANLTEQPSPLICHAVLIEDVLSNLRLTLAHLSPLSSDPTDPPTSAVLVDITVAPQKRTIECYSGVKYSLLRTHNTEHSEVWFFEYSPRLNALIEQVKRGEWSDVVVPSSKIPRSARVVQTSVLKQSDPSFEEW